MHYGCSAANCFRTSRNGKNWRNVDNVRCGHYRTVQVACVDNLLAKYVMMISSINGIEGAHF